MKEFLSEYGPFLAFLLLVGAVILGLAAGGIHSDYQAAQVKIAQAKAEAVKAAAGPGHCDHCPHCKKLGEIGEVAK